MSDYRETPSAAEGVGIKRARPVHETRYRTVVHEKRGLSAGSIVGLMLVSSAIAVVITILILGREPGNTDDQIREGERAVTPAAQRAPARQVQPAVPEDQRPPAARPESPPLVAQPPLETASADADLEDEVSSRLREDQDLLSYSIEVKVANGIATLSGKVPAIELRIRAEKLARTVIGVRRVTNNLIVEPQ